MLRVSKKDIEISSGLEQKLEKNVYYVIRKFLKKEKSSGWPVGTHKKYMNVES